MRYSFQMTIAAITLLAACPANAADIFTGFEDTERDICDANGGWVQYAAVSTYFEDSYYDFDKHMLAFTGGLDGAGKNFKYIMARSKDAQSQKFTFMHENVTALTPRIGRLLPRVDRPMDLPAVIAQMREGAVGDPYGDHHSEFLRVALAREMLSASDAAGADIARFLEDIAAVEGRLLGMKNGDATRRDARRLWNEMQALSGSYRGAFRPVARQTIFGDNLRDRLAPRITEICAARAHGSKGSQ